MSKEFTVGISFIALVAIALLIREVDIRRDYKNELDNVRNQIKAVKHERDSMKLSLTVTRDSLKIAFNTIDVAHSETEQAKQETQNVIKRYGKITFIAHPTDTARLRDVSELYPSAFSHR
jgi:uncharacterized protein (DUF3084 family)